MPVQVVDLSRTGAKLAKIPADCACARGVLFLESLELPFTLVERRQADQIAVAFTLDERQAKQIKAFLSRLQVERKAA